MRYLKFLALALALVLCMSGCKQEEWHPPIPTDPRDSLTLYEWDALKLYLDDGFTLSYGTEDSVCWTKDGVKVSVSAGALSSDADIHSSQSFAEAYAQMYQNAEINKKNGVHYLKIQARDSAEICGFYVHEDRGWTVSVTADSFDDESTMIQYATLCQVIPSKVR